MVIVKSKRVIISTVLGLVAGVLCYLGGKFLLKAEFTTVEFFMILFHRILLGFVIGISAIRIHWALHGILMGFIIGLPIYPLIFQEGSLIPYSLMGIVWGLVIEFFTSFVFKAKI